MSNNENKSNPNPLYLALGLIALLILGLIIQNISLNRKINSLRNEFTTETKTPLTTPRQIAKPADKGFFQNRVTPDFFSQSGDSQEDDPFQSFEKMHARLFQLMNAARSYAPSFFHQIQQTMDSDFVPSMDLDENAKEYMIRCDIPGLEKDKINITAKNNILTIQGVRESENKSEDNQTGFFSSERTYGSFSRSIPLPGPVDESQIRADYKNGVLTITLPKEVNGQDKPEKIQIQ